MTYVYWYQVARSFGHMKTLNAVVMKRLEEKSRGVGIVAEYVTVHVCINIITLT